MKTLAAAVVLTLCAPVLALPAAAAIAPAVQAAAASPDGKVDPDTITCRPPQTLPGKRLKGPEVCKTNAVWAQYRKDGMDVAADGIHDVRSEKWRTVGPQACHAATMGGGSTTNMNQVNFSQICD